MARFSPPFLFALQKKHKSSPSGKPPTSLPSDRMTLYLLVRARRNFQNSYAHEYELTVTQQGLDFVVELRSQIGYVSNWSSAEQFHRYTKPWLYQKKFELLDEAWQHASAILKDLRQYARINRPDSWWSSIIDDVRQPSEKIIYRYEFSRELESGRLAEGVATGKVPLPEGLEAGEIVRQLWGRSENAARTALLGFAHKAPFTYGHWTHWKWLYKQAEALPDLELLEIMLLRLDNFQANQISRRFNFSWTEQAPGSRTFDYMKRRGRRFMRTLAEKDPARYVELAFAILSQPQPPKVQAELDLRNQWISLDILYGHSRRFDQGGHSRGSYACRQNRPSLLTQDARAAEAWSQRPDLLLKLYTNPALSWQTLEWALKLLLVNKIPLPQLPNQTLWRFLQSPSLLLARLAVAQIISYPAPGQKDGTIVAATVYATVFMRGNGSQRRKLGEKLLSSEAAPDWNKTFATELARLVVQSPTGSKISRRRKDATELLVRDYLGLLDQPTITALIPVMLATGRSEFYPTIEKAVAAMSSAGLTALLEKCEPLGEKARQTLLVFLLTSFASKSLNTATVHNLVFSSSEWVRETGWRLLAGADVALQVIANQWEMLLQPRTPTAVLVSAASSPIAIRFLIQSSPNIETLVAHFTNHPVLMAHLKPESFAPLLKTFPLEALLKLVELMEQKAWSDLRERLLDQLRQDGRLSQFWRLAWKPLNEASNARLATRLLHDPLVSQTFREAADPTFLELPAALVLGPLLVDWMDTNAALFGQGARPLLVAATHKLPSVREWALRRLDAVGLTTPFALRLLESGLPQAIARGKEYFEAVPAGDPRELEYTLVICDSPDKSVQAYGREYLEKRRERLPVVELTRKLAEHPDSFIQETVATTLLKHPQLTNLPEVAEFDAAVLRGRDKGRRVKELVKKRFSEVVADTAANADPTNSRSEAAKLKKELLLEMARSRTPRDAEWAWQQLAQLAALAGEPIEGFEVQQVEGV